MCVIILKLIKLIEISKAKTSSEPQSWQIFYINFIMLKHCMNFFIMFIQSINKEMTKSMPFIKQISATHNIVPKLLLYVCLGVSF